MSIRTSRFHHGQSITVTRPIPGLTGDSGQPITVDITYIVDEIAHDWVAVADHDNPYDSITLVYGNHPDAVGPLDDLLPDPACKRRAWPKNVRSAVATVTGLIATADLPPARRDGIWVTSSGVVPRMVVVNMPSRFDQRDVQAVYNALREYLPYQGVRIHRNTDGALPFFLIGADS